MYWNLPVEGIVQPVLTREEFVKITEEAGFVERLEVLLKVL